MVASHGGCLSRGSLPAYRTRGYEALDLRDQSVVPLVACPHIVNVAVGPEDERAWVNRALHPFRLPRAPAIPYSAAPDSQFPSSWPLETRTLSRSRAASTIFRSSLRVHGDDHHVATAGVPVVGALQISEPFHARIAPRRPDLHGDDLAQHVRGTEHPPIKERKCVGESLRADIHLSRSWRSAYRHHLQA